MNPNHCKDSFHLDSPELSRNINKSLAVLIITLATMGLEIFYGYKTGSMALLADGWHMATHAAALGITFLTYKLATSQRMSENFNFGGGKLIFLGGFTSGILLLLVVLNIGYETVLRFFNPVEIQIDEALFVAVLGLIVNLICAFILREQPHDHGHSHDHSHDHGHDHNIRAAYIHVLADALTSVGAIIALLAAKYYQWTQLDPLIGLVGALLILKWSIGLVKNSAWELLDGHAKGVNYNHLKSRIEAEGVQILDLHVWRVAPKILNCELIVATKQPKGVAHYRKIIETDFHISHSVIEEQILKN